MTLSELFPDEDYRFQIKFERALPGDFFAPTDRHNELIAERQRWLERARPRHAAALPGSGPLIHETIELGLEWKTFPPDGLRAAATMDDPLSACVVLGTKWEPDFLLLNVDAADSVRLVAAAVCFPSSWALEEKIGHPVEIIHGVVPGLNRTIGAQIQTFLTKLKPGVAWLRSNWGLSRSPELNQHPARGLPRLDQTVQLEEVWLRVEEQAIVALPRTSGLLFGIRIVTYPLAEIAKSGVGSRLARALRTMPDALCTYKGLAFARNRLVACLEV
jgi:heme-dependent oxidative N-demethylase alpha subunit-like protein